MPSRKKSTQRKKKRKDSRRSRKQSRPIILRQIYYVQRPRPVYVSSAPAPPQRKLKRPHHYEYRSGDAHEHLNRVNTRPDDELSVQDRIQRQLKHNAENYKPNYMHVSSEELAIPAPRRVNGMRVFTNV